MAPLELGYPDGKLFINGEWRDASTRETSPVTNPATEETIASSARGGTADLDAAVAAARAAFESKAWAGMSARDRQKILWRLSDLLERDADSLAALETAHNGKPVTESKFADVGAAIDCLRYFSGWATKWGGDTLALNPDAFTYTLREPVGVVAAIVPWNFPLMEAVWKIAPALAVGCTAVLKPASLTPLTALRLAALSREAGLPPGVLNVVTGPGREIGMALVRHPGVDKVTFTGETGTGQEILRSSADTLKRVTLELGGKSANVVLADADLEAATRGAITGIFYGKGEVCAAGSRLLVERSIHDALVEKIAERAKKLLPMDPMDPKCRMGALVSKGQMEKVLGYIEKGKADGGRVVAGGTRADVGGRGYFVHPTVFDRVSPDHTIAREEIFGPVLAVIPFDDPEEALRIANASPYGLAAAVWTRDIRRGLTFARRLQAGTIWVNTYNSYDPALPFGGYKMSGYGRDQGSAALEGYTHVKSVWVDLR